MHVRLYGLWPGPGKVLSGRHVLRPIPAGCGIAQDGHADPVERKVYRTVGQRGILRRTGTHGSDAQLVQGGQRLIQPWLAEIEGVVVGYRHQIQTCLKEHSPLVRVSPDEIALVQWLALGGQCAFQVARGQISFAQQRAQSQPRVRGPVADQLRFHRAAGSDVAEKDQDRPVLRILGVMPSYRAGR